MGERGSEPCAPAQSSLAEAVFDAGMMASKPFVTIKLRRLAFRRASDNFLLLIHDNMKTLLL